MSDIPFVVDINSSENFQTNVIDKSFEIPVVVDFWATWCQPCQVLIPLLTDIAQQYNGAFLLAKIDSDQNQELAMQSGVKNLPTVLIFKQGQVVDSFTGVLPESEIKEILNKHISNSDDNALEVALSLMDEGNYEAALEQLKELNKEEPENYKIHLAIAQIYLQTKEYELCSELLASLPSNIQQEDAYKSTSSQLELALAVADAPELDELRQQIGLAPDDLQLQLQLANVFISQKNYTDALDILLNTVKKDIQFNDGIAKTNMLKVFEILGNSDPLVRQYRNKLFSFLN